MKKAQSIIEVSALLVLVVIISLTTMSIYNNKEQLTQLANLSKVETSGVSQNNTSIDNYDDATGNNLGSGSGSGGTTTTSGSTSTTSSSADAEEEDDATLTSINGNIFDGNKFRRTPGDDETTTP